MKKQLKQLAIGLMCMTPTLGFSALYNTALGKIDKINAYAEYLGGAVIISFETGTDSEMCPDGLYLSPTSTGFEMMANFALSSYMAGRNVYFGYHNDRRIPVGTKKGPNGDAIGTIYYCEIDSVRLGETK
jgi:hypothetical protein